MSKAKDAVQHYTQTYSKKGNIEQGRGKAGSTKVYNTEVKRPPHKGTAQEKERNIVTDRTTYNPKTGNITESVVGQPNLDYRPSHSSEKKPKGGAYPRTKKEYGYNEAGTMKSMIEIIDQLLTKCDSHVLTSETEDSLKKKKKQPEKANGHTLGTDPALRSDNEMVHVKEPDAYKSWQSGQRYREEQNRLRQARLHENTMGPDPSDAEPETEEDKAAVDNRDEETEKSNKYKLDYDEDGMPQTPEAQAEFDERGRRNAAMHAGIKPKVPKGVKPRKGEEVERSMTSIIDDLMQKAVLSSEQREDMSKKQFVFPGEKRYPIPDAVHGRNALARVAQHGTPAEKKKVRAAVHKKFPGIGEDDDKKEKSLSSTFDEIMEKARIRASKVRSVKVSPEREKEIIARTEKKVHALNTAGYRPDYSRTAQKIYEEESKAEKSIDERTSDLIKSGYFMTKDQASRKQIADAVRAVRLHREGMHKEAKEINPDPEKLATAAWKHNAMIAASQREKSIVNTWAKDSAYITKGHVMGPGGEEATLVKKNERKMYEKPLPKVPHGKRTPDYHQLEAAMDEMPAKTRAAAAKKRAKDLDIGAE